MWTNEEKINIATAALTNMFPDAHLDFWQEYALCDNSLFSHYLKSRRVGFSFINAIRPVSEAIYPGINRYQKVIISYNLQDAMGKIKDAREALMNLPESWRKPLKTDSKTALEFWDKGGKSVSQIISLPARGVRGFGTSNKHGGVLIDEGATISDIEDVYTSVLPSMSRGGTLTMGGTPEDKSGLFYDISSDVQKYPLYKRIVVPWWWSSSICTNVKEAIKLAPHMNTWDRVEMFGNEILQAIFSNIGLRQFQQEYEVTFTDESEAFISLEMINQCTPKEVEQYEYQNLSEMLRGIIHEGVCTEYDFDTGERTIETVEIPAYSPETHGTLYAGWDMGRSKDASIFSLIGYKDGKKHLWMTYELKNKRFDEQKAFAEEAMTALPIRKFMIDRNGLGMEFAEWAETKFPTRAIGVNFTNETKEDMANKVYLCCERQEYVFPNNKQLKADIHCIRKTKTATQRNKYDGHTKDSHADRFWSLALATIGIDDEDSSRSRFYDQYKTKAKKTDIVKPKTKTGNSDLDRIKRQIMRGRR